MIVLFTDFGDSGPYVGQMKAVLAEQTPAASVIDLLNDAPRFDVLSSAHLLAAYSQSFPADAVFLGVVDPTVGSADRRPVIVKVDGRYFVGPDNGLFDVLAARGTDVQWWEINWRPDHLSSSFHGRDLFAPVAAQLARGEFPSAQQIPVHAAVIDTGDLHQIIFIDHYGNAISAIRAEGLADTVCLQVGDRVLNHARTFSDVLPGQAFWYENANGLVEVAVNQGSAAEGLALGVGDSVTILSATHE